MPIAEKGQQWTSAGARCSEDGGSALTFDAYALHLSYPEGVIIESATMRPFCGISDWGENNR